MLPVILLGLAAFALAAVAGFFSIVGLAEFAAAAAVPIMVFGAVLETSKLIATGFLHVNWKTAPRYIKYPGVIFIISIMLITMMGIYGFISAAHSNQNTPLVAVEMQIKHIDQQINVVNERIERDQNRLKQLDEVVTGYLVNDRVTNAANIRKQQASERVDIEKSLKASYEEINAFESKKFELKQSVAAVEAKLGPAKQAAKLFGLDESGAVNIFIIMLMIPFDPFAVWLVIATTFSYEKYIIRKREKIEADKIEEENRKLQEKADEAERIKNEREKIEFETQQKILTMEHEAALSAAKNNVHYEEVSDIVPVEISNTLMPETNNSVIQTIDVMDDIETISQVIEPEMKLHESTTIDISVPDDEVINDNDIVEPANEDDVEDSIEPEIELETNEEQVEDIAEPSANEAETSIIEIPEPDVVTNKILDIIKSNPGVIDDLKKEISESDDAYPTIVELERVLKALDTQQSKQPPSSWIDTSKATTKQPFVTGNEHVAE